MIKILVTVGTSIFENYKNEGNFNPLLVALEKVSTSGGCRKIEEDYAGRVQGLKQDVQNWIAGRRKSYDFSAEVKSLSQICKELREEIEKEGEVEVHLLTSDTILGNLAGNILRDYLRENGTDLCDSKANLTPYVHCIESLKVTGRREFYKGVSNLFSKVFEIAGGYWDNIIFNITGGYKATVPFMVTLAYFFKRPVYYIFEDTDALVKIPQIPLREELLDVARLLPHKEWLIKLKDGIWDRDACSELMRSDFYKEFSHLVETEDYEVAFLNPIGVLLIHAIEELYFCIYATDEVINVIESDPRIKDLFSRKFWRYVEIGQKVEIKNGHLVYDDGDNPFRVFYRDLGSIRDCALPGDKCKFLVYKVFKDHDEYERYLSSNPYSDGILRNLIFKEYYIKK
ncbi:MAG: putative CRISPR-associated protein [candidate division WOR-3 bacterium]